MMVLDKKHVPLLFPLLLLAVFGACSDEEKIPEEGEYTTVNIADSLNLGEDEAKIFVLPTPLQVATALKSYDVQYDADIIAWPSKQAAATDFNNAVNLGMSTIDMGYAAVYGDYAASARYMNQVENLMDELGIRVYREKNLEKRFEENKNNEDSLYALILESYSLAHDHFQNTGREGVGLLILTGCFIEGLYICSHISSPPAYARLENLIAQQSEYLENIVQLLNFYSKNPDINPLLKDLTQLGKEFSSIKMVYDPVLQQRMVKGEVDPQTLENISEQIIRLRNQFRE